MYTQCPHCHTAFRIRTQQLKAAGGMARCCRCSEVFNALAHLREVPSAPPAAPDAPAPRRPQPPSLGAGPEGGEPAGPPAPPGQTSDPPRTSTSAREAGPSESRAIGEPSQDTGGDQAEEPLGEGSEAQPAEIPGEADRTDLPFHVPDDLPEIEPSEAAEHGLDAVPAQEPGPRSALSALGWGLGAFCLLVLALGQLLWWERDALAQHPQGRKLVEPMCEALGCRVPPRRAPDRIRVLSRDVSPHPAERDALLVMLVIANEAPFPQPYPVLQLTLYDKRERAFGQRRFTPQEYLGDPDPQPMQPDHAVYVRLELVDPGEQVTGFQFEFL